MVLFLFKVNKVNTCNCRIAPFTAVYMYFLEELFRKIPPNLQIENVSVVLNKALPQALWFMVQ